MLRSFTARNSFTPKIKKYANNKSSMNFIEILTIFLFNFTVEVLLNRLKNIFIRYRYHCNKYIIHY
jgi:hypothetical protein